MHICSREPSTQMRGRCTVRRSSRTTCCSCECVRDAYTIRGVRAATAPPPGAAPPSPAAAACTERAHTSSATATAAAGAGSPDRSRSACARRQPSAAHSRLSVFPVPVGLSSSALRPCSRASTTFSMYASCTGYASNGKSTSTPATV